MWRTKQKRQKQNMKTNNKRNIIKTLNTHTLIYTHLQKSQTTIKRLRKENRNRKNYKKKKKKIENKNKTRLNTWKIL